MSRQTPAERLSRLPLWAQVLLLAGAYFAAGRFGLSLAFVHSSASAVWPPTGLSLAALLLLGGRVWPGVFLGAFAVNAVTSWSLSASAAIAAGNTFEALAGAWLVARFAGGARAFDAAPDIFRFAALASIGSTVLSATAGTAALYLAGTAAAADCGRIWLTWWSGDMGGSLVVTPALVLWGSRPLPQWSLAKTLEALGLAAALGLLGSALFGGWLPPRVGGQPLGFLFFPLLAVAAFRFGKRGTAAAVVLLAAAAVRGTARGTGVFAAAAPNEALILLQTYLAAAALTALPLAAVVARERKAERKLRRAHDALERRVAERSAEVGRAEAELRRRTKVLTAILDNMAEGVALVDVDGRFLLHNKAAEAILGLERDAFCAQRWAESFRAFQADRATPMPEEADPVRRALAGESVDDYEALLGGSGAWVLGSARPLHEEGAVVAGLVVLRNISERRRAEEGVRRGAEELARSNAELSLFASLVSHELQEPARKILTFGGLLKTPEDPEQAQHLGRIQGAARHLQRLIEDILDLCRVTADTKPLELTDLDEVLAEVVADFSDRLTEAGGRVVVGPLPTLEADPGQMRQLFRNLLSNALKFRRPDAAPLVKVSCRPAPPGFSEIAVEDNGIGFEPQYAERIFKPFQRLHRRTAYEGSGIGLSVCSRILLRHGGSIAATGAPGRGATFIVTLPARTPLPPKTRKAAASAA